MIQYDPVFLELVTVRQHSTAIRGELRSASDLDRIIKLCEDFMSTYDPPLMPTHIEDLHVHLAASSLEALKLDEMRYIDRLAPLYLRSF